MITDLWDLALQVGDADDIPTVTRDPDDDYLVALARKSDADVLVTGDRDLLDLEQIDVEVLAPREFVEQFDTGEVAVEE